MTRKRIGNKATTLAADQRKERIERVIKMYLTGKSALEIANATGVNRQAVYQDLRIARRIWRKRNDRAAESLVAEEVAKIDRIEAAAWDAWERSQQDAVEITEDATADGKKSTSKKTKGQAGGAQYLTVALACVDKRCKMLKIGEYSTDESSNDLAPLVEVVVENQEQIAAIMEFGEYSRITTPSAN